MYKMQGFMHFCWKTVWYLLVVRNRDWGLNRPPPVAEVGAEDVKRTRVENLARGLKSPNSDVNSHLVHDIKSESWIASYSHGELVYMIPKALLCRPRCLYLYHFRE